MTRRRFALLVVVAVLAVWRVVFSAQSRPAGAPAQAPQRIVSLVPATTEMLYAMGAGAKVIGVGTYDHYPPAVEKLPRLGGLLDPNIEQLIALRPDLVIVYDTQTDLRRRLERAGIPMWSYSIKALADVTSTMRELGQRIGMAADAGKAADSVDAQLRAVQSRVAHLQRPRALLVFGREPGSLRGINASGGYGFLHDLLLLAGGTDVLDDVKQPAVSMSSEMVLARAPEVIIELHYGETLAPARVEAERRVWQSLPSVPAVKTGRIVLLMGNEFVVPGPRVVQAAEQLARALHPEAGR
ncbi:MAG: helical backbone metal receptor [Vicinamibacterales bacterium]